MSWVIRVRPQGKEGVVESESQGGRERRREGGQSAFTPSALATITSSST